jgi:hypothetical protein
MGFSPRNRKKTTISLSDPDEQYQTICASCEEQVDKREAFYEDHKYYHAKCAEVWKCVSCGVFNANVLTKCKGCGGEK